MTKLTGEPIRVVVGTAVRSMCAECDREVAGRVGLRMVLCGDLLGIEVYVCDEEEMHLVARVPLQLLPLTRWKNGNTGTATPK